MATEEKVIPQEIEMSNFLAVWTLYSREVQRFLKVYTQTLMAPIVTTLLFLAIFTLALGRSVEVIGGVSFSQFLAPGLIMMAVAQNAFANTSSSILVSKIQGNIVDTIMPPLTPHDLTIGYALGGATRGVIVAVGVGIVMSFFVDMSIHNLFFVVFHCIAAALMLSLLGVLGGIWAEKFDHIAAVTNFIITPLSFLSGTFYSIQRLPETVQIGAYFNPFFFMIDGFRYGFIGYSDTNPWLGVAVLTGVNLVLWITCYRLFKSGYRLKA
ncbi:MAG: ABC transporter permease [Rhodospirillales bacterium]|nr:ABC transporter permease [Rhodospirillales bacterium]